MENTKGECSCKVVSGFLCGNVIEYCPLHKSAPDLYEALKQAHLDIEVDGEVSITTEGIIDKALAKAGGK